MSGTEIAQLREEVAFWRRDAVARAWSAAVHFEAAASSGDADRAAWIKVGSLDPALFAIRDADAQYWHMCCEGCGKPLLTGHFVVHYEDVGAVHADCDNPTSKTEGEHVTIYDDGFSAEQMAQMLAYARKVAA